MTEHNRITAEVEKILKAYFESERYSNYDGIDEKDLGSYLAAKEEEIKGYASDARHMLSEYKRVERELSAIRSIGVIVDIAHSALKESEGK